MKFKVGIALAFAIGMTLTTGCSQLGHPVHPSRTPREVTPSATSAGQYRLIQYPDAGYGDFYAQTNAAKISIDMEMYELADATEVADLIAASQRGVQVRVLLDSAWAGRKVNTNAYNELSSHHVAVRWDPEGTIYHAKVTTFDGAISDISTGNLTSRYYATGRDAEIIDTNPRQVAAIEETFHNDWRSASVGVEGVAVQVAGLVWSPGAEERMVEQIAAAKQSIDFMSEELGDPMIYNALAADAKRGVRCRVVMNDETKWHAGFKVVTDAGCQLHVYPLTPTGLYIHEKLVLDDAGTSGESLMIGSQNATTYSLTRNRELSVVLTDMDASAVIHSVANTFDRDYRDTDAVTWRNARALIIRTNQP